MPEPFTILGATGRIGGLVARHLLARGVAVRVVVRTESPPWRERGAEVIVAAIEDEPRLAEALRHSAGVFAILPDDPAAADFHAHRTRMTEALAAAVRTADVPHVVFLSSVLAPHRIGLARDLAEAERALAAACCTVTILRSAFFQDNLCAALPIASGQGVFADLFPDAAIPMVAAADVARVAAGALLHPPLQSQVIEVAGPSYTPAQICALVGEAVGKRVEHVVIAERAGFLRGVGLPADFADALAAMYAALGVPRSPEPSARTITGATPLARTLASDPAPDRATIDGVVDALTAAWNRHDLVAMGDLYRADADFVNIFGGHLVNRDEIVREHAARHEQMFAHARMSHEPPRVRMLAPGYAVARVAWRMQGITGPDGLPAGDRRGLMLHVLEQRAGTWWIVTTQNTEVSTQAPPRFLDRQQVVS